MGLAREHGFDRNGDDHMINIWGAGLVLQCEVLGKAERSLLLDLCDETG